MKLRLFTVFIIWFTAVMQPAAAEDRLDLEGTSIIGNRELPKVLYIAPWKPPRLSEMDPPRSNLLKEEIAPLDRDVYLRELRYYNSLEGTP